MTNEARSLHQDLHLRFRHPIHMCSIYIVRHVNLPSIRVGREVSLSTQGG